MLKQWYAIQGIHKRMVRFQKLTRNLFLTLHWHNVRRQQRQLSFSCATSSSFLMLTAGPVSKMASQQEKAFCVLGWIWLPCGCVSCDPGCTHWRTVINAWEINYVLTFETAPFFCVYPVYMYIFKTSILVLAACYCSLQRTVLGCFLSAFRKA